MQHKSFHFLRLAILPAILLLGMMALVSSFSPVAHAASIVVDDAGDTLHSPGCADDGVTSPCTLRDAITYANSNAGADTITFNIPSGGACSSANTCTITLGSSLPAIAEDVTIDGAPNNGHITVSGNNAHPVFTVNIGTTDINALTIADGASGSISNISTLNVTNSTFTNNNHVGASGGAISNVEQLTVVNSTFYNNSATNGGAIDSAAGTATVINSTFSGNSATFSGGAVRQTGGSMTLRNNIFTNSTNGGNCAGTLTADSYNIADDNTCDSATQKTTAEIALGALADNGGPTQTMAIDENSAAWDHGDNTVCAAAPVNNLDQRGETRPQGMYCDTGAYEFVYSGWQTGPNFVVNHSADTDDGSCDELGQGVGNQDCTLREAILAANALGGANDIIFDIPGTDSGCAAANTCTILLTGNLPHITDAVTIDGASNNGHITVDGDNSHQIFWVEASSELIALTVANGSALLSSGGVYNSGATTLISSSTFIHNSGASGGHAKNDGGGLLTIVNSTFFDPVNGTAIGNTGSSTLQIYNSTIDGNNVGGSVGISNVSGTTTLYNTIVSNNAGVDCSVGGGSLTADGYNLDNDGTCDSATSKSVAEINLQLLADNGGATYTMALVIPSAALNVGNDSVCAAIPVSYQDQRGETRPQGLFCDVGAYEYVYTGFQTGPNFVVNHSADTDDGSCDLLGQGIGNQDCTLREAILAANALGGANDIIFDIPGTDSGCAAANTCTILLTGNLPHITDAVTIDGASNNGHITVDGDNSHQIFWVEASSELIALTVANGSALLSSGGVYNSGATTLISSSTFIHNSGASGGHAKNDGGGLLTIVNSTFFDPVNGTAIGNTGSSTLQIYNSTIDGNNVGGSVGISNVSGTTTLYNTIVSNNAGVDCSVGGGSLTADGYNLDNDGTCDSATSKSVAEINLQLLADNGGATYTMALVIPSAALNVGNDSVCAAIPVSYQDQRGVTRPQGLHCDVGAFEAQPPTAVNVTNVRGTVNGKGFAVVKWKTTGESQIAGFNVYRKTRTGEWKQINANFKQAKNPGDATGNKYRFVDRKAQGGKTYRYKIEVKYLDNHSEWTSIVKVKIP